MENKIKVLAKAQNQLALGIISAYLILYPDSTLKDLRKVFSNSIAPDKGVEELFLTEDEANEINRKSEMSLYFTKSDQILNINKDGRIALSQIWTKASLNRLINLISQFGIETELLDSTTAKEKDIKGFLLEYLNGFSPIKKKGSSISSFLSSIKSIFGSK